MSNRLDKEREAELQPKRMQYAIDKIREKGCPIITITETCILFEYNGKLCKHFAYSGWHSGKSIKDGRGIENLLKQLK